VRLRRLGHAGPGFQYLREARRLVRRDQPARHCADDCRDPAGEIGGIAGLRHLEGHRLLALRRDDAIDAMPQHQRVAGLGQLDLLAHQRFRLAVEQLRGDAGRAVQNAARPPGRVAGPTLDIPPAPVAPGLAARLFRFIHGTSNPD